jgi:hypothetical protein
MSTPRIGEYLVVCEGKVLHYLGTNSEEAVQYLQDFAKRNSNLRPDAYLVQVQAVLEYPPPLVRTAAHERLV